MKIDNKIIWLTSINIILIFIDYSFSLFAITVFNLIEINSFVSSFNYEIIGFSFLFIIDLIIYFYILNFVFYFEKFTKIVILFLLNIVLIINFIVILRNIFLVFIS